MAEHFNRAAVALNNAGVNLLERGRYKEAMATCKDAVKVIKIGLSRVSTCSSEDQIDIDDMLSKATQRMSDLPSRINDKSHPLQLHICSLDDIPTCAGMAVDEGPSLGLAFAIRIDDVETDSGFHFEKDIDSAVILHNFAVSYLCLSMIARKKHSVEKILDGAKKIFAASHAILVDRQYHCEDENDCKMMLLLDAIVLGNLVLLYSTSKIDRSTSTKLFDKYSELRTIIYEELSEYCAPLHGQAAAAA